MEEYARYGKRGMKIIRNLLLEYKEKHRFTNAEMAQKCNMSIPAFDKIMNPELYSNLGCYSDTFFKIIISFGFDANAIIESLKEPDK